LGLRRRGKREKGVRSSEQGIGIGEQGVGIREHGVGIREHGLVNKKLGIRHVENYSIYLIPFILSFHYSLLPIP
jgi:hypothetical protein